LQLAKFNVNIGNGKEIHIGDVFYPELSTEAIEAIANQIFQKLQTVNQVSKPDIVSVNELVQQVRSHIHDDIQLLHGKIPLWGVDHWVPLGDLFVDVNILEDLSSSRRLELNDLWQDFRLNPSYCSLERIGLGRKRERISGIDVLEKDTNLMVVGKPGSGKTTYLQHLVIECNFGNIQSHYIPVLIRLREFVDDGYDVAYSLEHYLEKYWQLSDIETKLVLNHGRALILLDGLDEITGDNGKKITKEIKKCARNYPKVKFVITCRTQNQESRFNRFDYLEIADFNESQVKYFAKHWFQTVIGDESGEKRQAFLKLLFLEENKQIRELAITPLLLSLACAVFYQTGKFYSKKSNLYEEGLEILLEKWDKSREIERDQIYRDLSIDRKLDLLSHLAIKKFEQPQYVLFEKEEIEEYIADFLGIGIRDGYVILKAIESQHGLLIERSLKVWSFSHLTFQEYLVAKHFLKHTDWRSLSSHTVEKHWREIFVQVLETMDLCDALLLLMKQEIDILVCSQEKLQVFLSWVNQKSKISLENIINNKARLFYVSLNVDFWVDTNDKELSKLEIDDLETRSSYYIYLAHELNLRLDMYINSVLNDALTLINVFSGNLEFELHCDEVDNIALSIEQDFESILDFIVDPKLKRVLQNTIKSLPSIHHIWDTPYQEWWQLNGKLWTTKLRQIFLNNFDMGHDWQFSNKEKEILKQYYEANEFIVKCINKCILSDVIYQEIADTLFLPISELEIRKLEKI